MSSSTKGGNRKGKEKRSEYVIKSSALKSEVTRLQSKLTDLQKEAQEIEDLNATLKEKQQKLVSFQQKVVAIEKSIREKESAHSVQIEELVRKLNENIEKLKVGKETRMKIINKTYDKHMVNAELLLLLNKANEELAMLPEPE